MICVSLSSLSIADHLNKKFFQDWDPDPRGLINIHNVKMKLQLWYVSHTDIGSSFYWDLNENISDFMLTLCNMDCSLKGFSVHGDSPGKNAGVGCYPSSRIYLPYSGIKPVSLTSPVLAGGFLPLALPGKPLLLLLSRFSRVRLCATPETAAHQAPLSLGFSRQEHWSGLPFPSPMHDSEKWKWRRWVVSDS